MIPAIKTLLEYTKIHFYTEEIFLRDTGYPDLITHQKYHRALVEKSISAYQDSMDKKDPAEFLNFLKLWWVDHINKKDQAYAAHVIRHLK